MSLNRLLSPTPAAPPGTGRAARFVDFDGQEMTVVAEPDAVEVYYGRAEFRGFAVSHRMAVRLAWFLLWRYWVVSTWCGLRTFLWRWSAGVIVAGSSRRDV